MEAGKTVISTVTEVTPLPMEANTVETIGRVRGMAMVAARWQTERSTMANEQTVRSTVTEKMCGQTISTTEEDGKMVRFVDVEYSLFR